MRQRVREGSGATEREADEVGVGHAEDVRIRRAGVDEESFPAVGAIRVAHVVPGDSEIQGTAAVVRQDGDSAIEALPDGVSCIVNGMAPVSVRVDPDGGTLSRTGLEGGGRAEG